MHLSTAYRDHLLEQRKFYEDLLVYTERMQKFDKINIDEFIQKNWGQG